jgi:hypothetical protein
VVPVAAVRRAASDGVGLDLASQPELDPDSRQWIEQLRVGHPRYQPTVVRLHDLMARVAAYELSRRRRQLRSISGPEFDDLAQQAADDALLSVLDKLDDFRGLSRFTTWATTPSRVRGGASAPAYPGADAMSR